MRTSQWAAEQLVAEGRRLVGRFQDDPDTGLADIGRSDKTRIKAIAAAAARKMAEPADCAKAMAEVLAGAQRTRPV